MEKINLNKMVGKFLPSEGETCFSSLDGRDVKKWLESQGHKVIAFWDTGRCGIAKTDDGFLVSTNGYVTKEG